MGIRPKCHKALIHSSNLFIATFALSDFILNVTT